MGTRRYIPILGVAAAAVLLSSCVKDTLYNTPHPDSGAVKIIMQGVTAADGYVADIGGKAVFIAGSPFVYPELLASGTYGLVVYNRADGFVFDGRMAKVETLSGDGHAEGSFVIPMPGYLRTVSHEIAVIADDTLLVNPVVGQRVRDLYFELRVTQGRPEQIQSVKGTLSGIAGTFDMEAGKTAGTAVSTEMDFVRESDQLTAEARLLGTMGTAQTLVLDILFTDGGRTQRTEIDLTEVLAAFNGDMTTGYKVTGTLETPVGMEEGTGSITGWEPVTGDDVDAEL